MNNFKYSSLSEENILNIAEKLAKNIEGGEVFLLSGILGAGKTFMVKNIAKVLKVKNTIKSPTFNILLSYECIFLNKVPGFLYHFDFYRLKGASDLNNLGFYDILKEKNNVIFIEWPECIKDKNLVEIIKRYRRSKIFRILIEMGDKKGERRIKIV